LFTAYAKFTVYAKFTAYAGSLSGSMNMMGNLGGVLGPIFAAILKMSGNNWTLTFWVSAALYLIGAACWFFIDPVTPFWIRKVVMPLGVTEPRQAIPE